MSKGEMPYTDGGGAGRCEIIKLDNDVANRLELAAAGCEYSAEEIARRYLRYGMRNHGNAVYGDGT